MSCTPTHLTTIVLQILLHNIKLNVNSFLICGDYLKISKGFSLVSINFLVSEIWYVYIILFYSGILNIQIHATSNEKKVAFYWTKRSVIYIAFPMVPVNHICSLEFEVTWYFGTFLLFDKKVQNYNLKENIKILQYLYLNIFSIFWKNH